MRTDVLRHADPDAGDAGVAAITPRGTAHEALDEGDPLHLMPPRRGRLTSVR